MSAPAELVRTTQDEPPKAQAHLRVAYIMSRFPRLTETFVLAELLAMRRAGVDVRIYPLLRERARMVQPAARPLVAEANYLPFLSLPILASQLYFAIRSPRRYFGAWWAVVRGTFRSRNFLVGAVAIFPKVAHAARLMRAEGVTHVHCHFANHPAVAGLIVHRLVGIPFSFTAHGSDLHVDRRMLRQKVAEASFVVTISDFNKGVILRECGGQVADKVVVIHCGVDTSTFQPAEARPATTLNILCIGTLHEVKGQRHLIEACRLLDREGLAFRCRLVGDGQDRDLLRRLIERAGLTDKVELLGLRTQDNVARLIQEADVVVVPSVPTRSGKREGIPVVLMEAMSSGVAVVASRLSGIPELVIDDETGLLTPPGDAQAIADALRRLAADAALRRRLALAGRQKVSREFDVERNARALARLFNAGAA